MAAGLQQMAATTIGRMAGVIAIAAQMLTSQRARQAAVFTIRTVQPHAKLDERQSIAASRGMART